MMTDVIAFTRASLVRSIAAVLLVALLALGLVGSLFWAISSNIGQTSEYRERLNQSLETQLLARLSFSALQDAVVGERGYLLTGDTAFLEPYELAVQRLPSLLDRFLGLTAGSSQHESALQLEEHARAELAVLAREITAYRESGAAAAVEMVTTREGKRIMDQIRATVSDISAAEQQDIERYSAAVNDQTTRSQALTLGLASAMTLLLIGAAVAAGWYILHRRRAEEELVRGGARSEAASRAKTEFLASMSHEIRTPLNGIVGYTDLLLDQNLPKEHRRLAERIQFAGAALLTVVNDILDFSKIEAGQVELNSRPFSLRSLVDNTASIVAALAERKELALEVDLDPELPQAVAGDEARIRQVLLNLLNNAVKFTQEGSVRLHVECDRASGKEECIRFSVTDTGIGIPEDQRKHLFHRFYQVNQSSTRQFGGTGLGLAISKHLVQLMGGQIGLESKKAQGSTFWFVIPLPRAEADAIAEEHMAVASETGHSGRILLVEDLEHNRDLARAVLTGAGHEVDTAENGVQAIDAVQAKSYDLVLMDIQMPIMDGITATQKIREIDGPASQIPIVAMTANVLPHQVKTFWEAGMNDHVGKPFKRPELLRKVNVWLERVRHEGQSAASGEQVGDTKALDELREMMGPEWVEGGLKKLRQQIEETFGIKAATFADRRELARRAHQLVSHAGLLGFERLSKLCSRLEEACKSDSDLEEPFQEAKAEGQVAYRQARASHQLRSRS